MRTLTEVLIIDDDLDDQVLMKQAFEVADPSVSVQFATRSDEALAMLTNPAAGDLPSIIVSDYNMPMMNGEEFLKRLAGDARYEKVPKVIVSTAASDPVVEACLAQGASKYFLKPSDFEQLVQLAKTIIELATDKQAK